MMKLGYLGFGNLARAIDTGLRRSGGYGGAEIFVCAKSSETRAYAEGLGYIWADDAEKLFSMCDIVIIAVKPSVFREMSRELMALNTDGKRVVSVMADVHIDTIAEIFSCPIMRVMPTLASAQCRDMIGYSCAGDFADIAEMLSHIGKVEDMSETKLDYLTVACSCGLGFAAHIMDKYMKQCISYGFTENEAESMTRRMFASATECDGSFDSLYSRVATKGGATEAGCRAMDAFIEDALSSAFDAAAEKAIPKK